MNYVTYLNWSEGFMITKTLVECACLNASSKRKTLFGKTGRNFKNVFIHCPSNDSLRRVTALEFYFTCFEKSITLRIIMLQGINTFWCLLHNFESVTDSIC